MNLDFIEPHFTTDIVSCHEALHSGKPFVITSCECNLIIPLEENEELNAPAWICFSDGEKPRLMFDCDFDGDDIYEMVDDYSIKTILKMIPKEEN